MNSRVANFAATLVLCLLPIATTAVAGEIQRVVALGDSLFDDSRGTRSPVAAEHVAEAFGAPLTNLSRSGSTSADLIAQGQHTAAASQFGESDLAMLWIGGNDVFAASLAVAAGFDGVLDDMAANVDQILGTLRQSGIDVLVLNLPDMSRVPAVRTLTPPLLLPNFRELSLTWRDQLRVLADQHGAHIVDVLALDDAANQRPQDFELFGHPPVPSPEIGCSLCWYADFVHPSSLAQGLVANEALRVANYDLEPTTAGRRLSTLELSFLAGLLVADSNSNGEIDAADYNVWRDTWGSTVDLRADANGNGIVDAPDYNLWRDSLQLTRSTRFEVPEPTSTFLCGLALACWAGCGRRRPVRRVRSIAGAWN